MTNSKKAICLALALSLAGCASMPSGPNVRVMPAPGKPFDQFQAENQICKDFAQQQLGKDPNDLSQQQLLGGALAGAALGAAAGAILGQGSGSAVATGAGLGGVLGSAVGGSSGGDSRMTMQHRYDIAYQQCMYSKGNQVPGYTAPSYTPPPPPTTPPATTAPAPSSYYPPPPPPNQ